MHFLSLLFSQARSTRFSICPLGKIASAGQTRHTVYMKCVALISLLLSCCTVHQPAHNAPADHTQQMLSAFLIVRDKGGNAIGSGALIDVDGVPWMLTANHVIRALPGQIAWACHRPDSQHTSETCASWRISNAVIDKQLDLARVELVSTPEHAAPAPYDADYGFSHGEPLWLLGNPAGLPVMLSQGILQGYRDSNQMYTTASAWMGSSGGPVFNADGVIVGVFHSMVGTSAWSRLFIDGVLLVQQSRELAEGLNCFSRLDALF